jgi:hypothetical protein
MHKKSTNILVICGSPDLDPKNVFIFTPAWQWGVKFTGALESRKVLKVTFRVDVNGIHQNTFDFIHSPVKQFV